MAADYAEAAQDALETLTEAGAVAVLTWALAPVSDAPDAATPAPVSVSAYGAIFDFGTLQVGTQPDSLIKAGDRYVLLATTDTAGAAVPDVPAEARVIAPDGLPYVVRSCKTVGPAGVPVLYKIHVRR